MTLVIGIDPSLTATGIADHAGDTSVITYPKGCEGDQRLARISDRLQELIFAVPIATSLYAVIEDLPTHGKGAGQTGMVQGVVRLKLIEFEIPYVTVPPASLKLFATGKGTAPKPDLRMELFKRTGIDLPNDNKVDAWWLRELGLHKLGNPTITLPKINLKALDKVEDWNV